MDQAVTTSVDGSVAFVFLGLGAPDDIGCGSEATGWRQGGRRSETLAWVGQGDGSVGVDKGAGRESIGMRGLLFSGSTYVRLDSLSTPLIPLFDRLKTTTQPHPHTHTKGESWINLHSTFDLLGVIPQDFFHLGSNVDIVHSFYRVRPRNKKGTPF